jgi:hypothetical protein
MILATTNRYALNAAVAKPFYYQNQRRSKWETLTASLGHHQKHQSQPKHQRLNQPQKQSNVCRTATPDDPYAPGAYRQPFIGH